MTTSSLRYLNVILTALTLVMGLNLYVQVTAAPSGVAEAQAAVPKGGGIPDEGAQRHEMIKVLKSIDSNTNKMQSLMSSGKMKVRIELPEKK